MTESPQTLIIITLASIAIYLLATYLGDCAGRSMKAEHEAPFRFGPDHE